MVAIKHQNTEGEYPKATFAIKIPSKDQLLEAIELGHNVLLTKLGIAYVHPDDMYNKKVGRETAISKMQSVTGFLDKVEIRERNRVVFNYTIPVLNEKVKLARYVSVGISYIPESDKTRLEYMYME